MLITLLALSFLVVGLHVLSYQRLSPIDETIHIDYLVKASRGELIERGERLGQTAMRAEACHRIDNDFDPPACDAENFDPNDFAFSGYNTAYTSPPLYYATTGLAARALVAGVPWMHDLVTAARLLGAAWLAIGLVLTWLLLDEFRVPLVPRVFSLLIVIALPTVIHASSTVNNDATALAAGAAVLLTTVRYDKGKGAWWWIALAVLFAVGTKSVNAVGIGLAVLYLAVRLVQTRGNPEARNLQWRALGTLVGTTAVAVVGWSLVQAAIAEVPGSEIPMIQWFAIERIELRHFLSQIGATFSPAARPYIPAFLGGTLAVTLVAVTEWVLIGAAAAAVVAGSTPRRVALGVSVVVGLLIAGPFLVLVNYVGQDMFTEIPARYGLSALAAMIVLVGCALARRPLVIAVAGLAILSVGRVVVELIEGSA